MKRKSKSKVTKERSSSQVKAFLRNQEQIISRQNAITEYETRTSAWPAMEQFVHKTTVKFNRYHTLDYLSADDKLIIFFLFWPENRLWYFMQTVS